jgi:hypothetical protein
MCDLRPVHKRQMCQPAEHCGRRTVFIQKNSSFNGSFSFCNTPNVCVERGHSRQNLGQLPNTSIVLQEVVVLRCVESVFVVLLLWLVPWSLFCGRGGRGVGEEWERSPPAVPCFYIFFRVCRTDILSQFPI